MIIRCKVLARKGNSYDLVPLDPELSNKMLFGLNPSIRLVAGDTVEVEVLPYHTKSNKPMGRILKRIQLPGEPAFTPRKRRR